MGREVKRVPMDFDWPQKVRWIGYTINYCSDSCDLCKQFAKIVGINVEDDDCPDFPRYDPPEGEGWQMWENVSDGSPISPVKKSPEELAQWLADTKASAFPGHPASYEKWLKMIKEGDAPTAVISNGEFKSGVEACV